MREPRPVGYSPLVIAVLLVIVVAIAAYATPLVSISKPTDKEIVSGIADIEVTYTSDSGSPIVRVEVYIDGHPVKDVRLEEPKLQGQQSFRWDFTLATPSTHSISARAMDATGAIGAAGIKVVVQRRPPQVAPPQGQDRTPPTVDIYYPTEGQVVSGEIKVKADVSDNVGVRTVIFYLDGEFKTMIMNSPNYSDRIDTLRLPDGPHVVSASAWDMSDNEGKSEQRTFVVRNREATTLESGDSRIARSGGPAPRPPTLQPPAIPEPQVGHEAPPVKGPEPGVPTVATGDQGPPPEFATSPRPVTTQVFGSGATPRTSPPSGLSLPTPPSPKVGVSAPKPTPAPTTSGLVASLPAHTETRAASTGVSTPASPPFAGAGGELVVEPEPPPPAEAVAEVAMLTSDPGPRSTAPAETPGAPKTASVPTAGVIVVASPDLTPTLGYDSQPLGELRQDRVAALPARRAEQTPQGKIGQPAALDVESMARFRDVKIVFNGELLSLRTAPVILDGISMTPLREVFEHTDGVLYWFHVEKRVRAVNPDTELELSIGDPTVTVNGNDEGLVLAPFIKNGRTMVPLEFVARTLDVTVSFNSDTGELIVSSNKF